MQPNAWDKREDESEKAYTAFVTFLSLRKPRKLANIYPDSPKRLPMMKRWSATHKWFERAEAYDADMATAEHRARREARAEAAGDSELENYRKRLEENAKVIGGLARAVAAKTVHALKGLKDGVAVPSSISSATRAASQGLQTEADLLAIVVGVDDMIGAFNRGQDEDE